MISTDDIFKRADTFARGVYGLSKSLPKSEAYGVTSQLKRAALSVPLNVLEGYSRQSRKSEANFLKIAYGSLKESLYLIEFAVGQGLFPEESAVGLLRDGDELAKIIWTKTETLSGL
ncbi:four helix bundle protein [Candidatus Saccharibacteria bacterium]|nr:four helix bundle protein [Candidatus Saccharibacteria bacterium]